MLQERRSEATTRALPRREFLRRSAVLAGVGAVAPFSFVRGARAEGAHLYAYLQHKLQEISTPSIAVSVVRGDGVVFATGVGKADIGRGIDATKDTVYQLASVSKTVTCAGIMTLVEDGVLDLDADINRYLPFGVHIPAAPRRPITLRQLLTHTASIRDHWQVWGTPKSDPTLYFHGDSPIPLRRFLHSYFAKGGGRYDAKLNFYDRPPGTAYSYSNFGVALAGYVAEAASRTDFDELCKTRILLPLGMTDAGFRLADVGTTNLAMPYYDTDGFQPIYQYGYPDYPDGALRTSASHLARWLGAFMNDGAFQGDRVLRRSTVQEIRRNQIPDIASWRQGLIWYEVRRWGFPILGHTGGDYGESTRMFYAPKLDVGVVTLTNAYMGRRQWRAFSEIERHMFEVFA
jgi:CubicO group peptidase (beta-lactamase class C family)